MRRFERARILGALASCFSTGATHPILEELKGLDVDGLTPRDALNLLGEWKKKVDNGP